MGRFGLNGTDPREAQSDSAKNSIHASRAGAIDSVTSKRDSAVSRRLNRSEHFTSDEQRSWATARVGATPPRTGARVCVYFGGGSDRADCGKMSAPRFSFGVPIFPDSCNPDNSVILCNFCKFCKFLQFL